MDKYYWLLSSNVSKILRPIRISIHNNSCQWKILRPNLCERPRLNHILKSGNKPLCPSFRLDYILKSRIKLCTSKQIVWITSWKVEKITHIKTKINPPQISKSRKNCALQNNLLSGWRHEVHNFKTLFRY